MAEQTMEDTPKTEQVVEKAREMGEQVSDKARQAWDQGSEKLQEYTEAATDWVRENPMYGVLIAFGVGALVGMMIRGRD